MNTDLRRVTLSLKFNIDIVLNNGWVWEVSLAKQNLQCISFYKISIFLIIPLQLNLSTVSEIRADWWDVSKAGV